MKRAPLRGSLCLGGFVTLKTNSILDSIMKKLFILIFVMQSITFLGQNPNIDSYKNYRDSRPKYKKIIYEDITDSTKIQITSSLEWKKNKRIWTFYNDSFNWTAGTNSRYKGTNVTIYNRFKRNVIVNEFYTNDSLKAKTRTNIATDSTIRFNDKNEIIFKSKYNARNKTWTIFKTVQNGKNKKEVLINDSLKETHFEYENDTLISKEITYRHSGLTDSIVTFGRDGKMLNKIVHSFNKFGDIILYEEFDFSEPIPIITKTTYSLTYDKNHNWIKSISTTARQPSEGNKHSMPIKPRYIVRRKIFY
jgi:hypothetical protein